MTKHCYESADKGSLVVVSDRDDYIYEEVCKDPGPLISSIHEAIEKIRKRRDLNVDTIRYFMVKDTKFAPLYLLPKIHK